MNKIIKVYQSLKTFLKKFNCPQSSYIEFDDFFQSEGMMNAFGFNNLPRDTPLNRSNERKIFYTVSMINSFLFLCLNIFSFVYGLTQDGSFLIIIENVAVVCIEGLVLIKGFTIMYWRREKFMDMVLKLKLHFPHNAWDQHVFSVPQHLKILKICGTLGSVLYKLVLFEFTTMPIFILLHGFVFSQNIKLELVIQLQLPLNTSALATYVILYFINIWAFIVGTFTIIITDLLFVELVAIINMELTALAQLISETDPAEGQDKAFDELKNLSITHQELINLSEDLKDILSPLLFIDCFGMLITICCCAFLTLVNFLYLLKFCCYFLIIVSFSLESVHIFLLSIS